MIQAITELESKPKIKLPNYAGSLDIEELIVWISELEKYFDVKNVDNFRKVKFAVTKFVVEQNPKGDRQEGTKEIKLLNKVANN